MIMVTHHVEEIAPGFTHVLMIRQGKVLAAARWSSNSPPATCRCASAFRSSWSRSATAGPHTVSHA